jgi:hypothetical protein
MKNLIKLLSLLTFTGLILISCEGPMGMAGKDGLNGQDGKDANAACIKCHTTANWDAKEAQYQLSKHFYGTSSARNTKWCARCHTNEGFKEITSKPWASGAFISVTNDMENGTRITCETCHKHSGFDFTDDTVTQVLRTTSPVSLAYNNYSKTTDFGKIGNLCGTCHQIRGVTSLNYTDATVTPSVVKTYNQLPFFPLDNSKENTTVKYLAGTNFSVHDGNQMNMFKGINGYEYAGQTYTKTWKHSDWECVDCHMNEYNPTTKTGGHTMIPNEEACKVCHDPEEAITQVETLIGLKKTELAEKLVARKVLKKVTNATTGAISYSPVPTHDFLGTLFPTTQTTTLFATGLTTANTTTSGVTVYANNVTMDVDPTSTSSKIGWGDRIGREWKYGELGAAYNYGYVASGTLAIHNPPYALQLLQKSIDWLNANP